MKSLKSIMKLSALLGVFLVCFSLQGSMFSSGLTPTNVSDSLQFADTTSTVLFSSFATDVYVTISDSSNSKADSVKIYLITDTRTPVRYLYSLLSVHEQSQTTATTNVSLLIPGDGVTTTYAYHSDTPVIGIYIVRVNVGTNVALAGYPYKTNLAIGYVNNPTR